MTDFVDRSVIAGAKRRESDGMLVADVRVARTGVQLYRGREVDRDNLHGFRDKAIVRVYRPGEEVFSVDTMASAAHRPVTNNHPATKSKLLDSTTWKEFAVGNTSDEVSAEGIFLRVPLIVSDEAAIQDVEGGKRELSAGYTSVIDWTSGTTPAGEAYDAIQREIRFNHIAIVHRGRAGSSVGFGDAISTVDDGEDEGEDTMADKPLKTVTVDGLSIETTDQGAQVIEKLQRQIAGMTDAATTATAAHSAALAEKDKALATADAKIADLEKKVLSDADLDKLVTARADAVSRAVLVHKDVKTAGASLPDIRKDAVRLKLGDKAIEGKSQDYIDAMFDILAADAEKGKKTDTFRAAAREGLADADAGADAPKSAYQQMIADMAASSAGPATAKAS